MSNNLPPSGYRSWLHYTVEKVSAGELVLSEPLSELQAQLADEDARVIRIARENDIPADQVYWLMESVGMSKAEMDAGKLDVLSKAVISVATALHVSRQSLETIYLRAGASGFEASIRLVEIYRRVLVLLGGDSALVQQWFRNSNRFFDHQTPLSVIQDGRLAEMLSYLGGCSDGEW